MDHSLDFSLVKAYFHISPEGADQPEISAEATALLNPERMKEIIEAGGRYLRATKPDLAASSIGISVFGLCSTIQLFAARHNLLLDLSLDNLLFQIECHEGHPHIGYQIKTLRWTEIPDGGQARENFLIRQLSAYYEKSITPLVQSIAAAAGVKPDLIWNQFGSRNIYIRSYLMKSETCPDVRARLNENFRIQTELLSPELFNRRRNPFYHVPRYIDNPYNPEEPLMIRSSCCMYYCREEAQMCYSCPRLTVSQRDEMKEKILEKAK